MLWNAEDLQYICATNTVIVAQLVRASDCGSEGRGFETPHSPKSPGKSGLFCFITFPFNLKCVPYKEKAMSLQIFIGSPVNMATLRNYIFEHRINKNDIIVLNPTDYDHLLSDIKNSAEEIPVPLQIFGVRITKDNTATIELGKVQVIKDENTTFQ